MSRQLAGIFAPITTPFDHEELSVDRLRENVQRYSATPLAGLFVLGSNGENKSLTEDEKLQVVEAVIDTARDDLALIVGSGFESTHQTIAFSKQCQALGADFVSLLMPSYYKKLLGNDAMIKYYSDVADALTIPVLVYNAPGYTGVSLPAGVVEALSRHPNIAGMKDTSGDFIRYLAIGTGEFHILAGSINSLFPALMLGASGGVVSLADIFPQACVELYEEVVQGNLDSARRHHRELLRLNHAISGSFGVAGVKHAMDLAGYFGGEPRLPLLPLTDAEKQRVGIAISDAKLQ
jgi:4-hydroxy-2-oxoglutarate aldolase